MLLKQSFTKSHELSRTHKCISNGAGLISSCKIGLGVLNDRLVDWLSDRYSFTERPVDKNVMHVRIMTNQQFIQYIDSAR